MSRHPAMFLVAILLLSISIACTTVVGAPTPEEAARQNFANSSPENMATFQVVGTRRWERGVVVLYSYFRAQKQMFGYALVTQMPPARGR